MQNSVTDAALFLVNPDNVLVQRAGVVNRFIRSLILGAPPGPRRDEFFFGVPGPFFFPERRRYSPLKCFERRKHSSTCDRNSSRSVDSAWQVSEAKGGSVVALKALERVCYVEDEADIRAIAEIALTQIGGFSVDLCDSGETAVVRTPLFKPDLILLDVMMPGMCGIETFKRLRGLPDLTETPVVFITAKSNQRELEKYRMLGAADVISKPFDPVSLPERLQSIWRKLTEKTR